MQILGGEAHLCDPAVGILDLHLDGLHVLSVLASFRIFSVFSFSLLATTTTSRRVVCRRGRGSWVQVHDADDPARAVRPASALRLAQRRQARGVLDVEEVCAQAYRCAVGRVRVRGSGRGRTEGDEGLDDGELCVERGPVQGRRAGGVLRAEDLVR